MTVKNAPDSSEPLPEAVREALPPVAGEPPAAGLATAVELALQRSRQVRAAATVPADQLPLLGVEPVDDESGNSADPGNRVRGGRPKGARNKRTEAWLEFLDARYRSPLVVLAEAWSRPVDVLQAELGCTRLEAYALQQQAAIASAPYWHAKQPLALQVEGKGVVQLILEAPSHAGNSGESGAEGMILEARIISEEKQPLSKPETDGVGK
jgi:hypothetical protein